MEEDEINQESFMSIEKQFHVTGGARKLISKPENLEYSMVRFDDMN